MTALTFAPLLPWPALAAVAAACAALVALALWRGLRGWWLRGLAALALVAALANPQVQDAARTPLRDIALIVADQTASNRLATRGAQTTQARAALEQALDGLGDVERRTVTVPDAPRDQGSLITTAITDALADLPRDRLAGVFVVSDGLTHDAELALDLPAPLHLLQTGQPDDWDRRLVVANAPAYAILGEPVTLTLRVADQGAVPPGAGGQVALSYAVDGGARQQTMVPVGQDMEIDVTLERGGMNVLEFAVARAPGELTDRNNRAIVQINGVRDRLRVLLVSGAPSAGQRTWRNLLKSDPAVDLVHFTILRPADRQDGVPVNELSLIAFPTRELFIDKIDEFDLIVLDRYRMRGILPPGYFANIVRYVKDGGALMVVGGPELAGAQSIWRSPLGDIFPARPTARMLEEGFRPEVTELGTRHPVTAGLPDLAPRAAGWGRWFRQVEMTPQGGQVVMRGIDERPLLVLDRVEAGRLALLASDHAWLWDRGFEGGGPQLELLRRLAHWMMGEPELEEEALTAQAEGRRMTITRRTLSDSAGDVTVTAPDGAEVTLPLRREGPGDYRAEWTAPEIGLYRLRGDGLESVVALGPQAPREYARTIATPARLDPLIAPTRGGVAPLADRMPELRTVRAGRAAAGRGWLGLTPRNAHVTTDITTAALLPGWAWLVLAAGLAIGAWLREGR